MRQHTKSVAVAFLVAAAALAACTTDEELEPCPPRGIGVEVLGRCSAPQFGDHAGGSYIPEGWTGGCSSLCEPSCQLAQYQRFACEAPQICWDMDRILVDRAHGASNPAKFVVFLLTNCSTGTTPLKISGITVYGDERCAVENFSDASFEKKTLQPGETIAVRTTYRPKEPGEDAAEFRVLSNAQNYPELRLLFCGRSPPPVGSGGDDAGQADTGWSRYWPSGSAICKEQMARFACHL